MTSPNSSLSTILSEPDVARLIAEPGPWWIWSADASKLLLANLSGARAMGATGVAIAMERDYAATHAFAGQVARLAPLLPADGTPRSERMRIAGRFGSESVVAEAWRLRAGDVGLIALRLPSLRRGSPREATIAFVTDLRLPALAFDTTGTPLAASGGASALASTSLHDLIGPAAAEVLATVTTSGRTTIQLVNGPMTLVGIPAAHAVVAVLAPEAGSVATPGLRLVTPAAVTADEPAGEGSSETSPALPEPTQTAAEVTAAVEEPGPQDSEGEVPPDSRAAPLPVVETPLVAGTPLAAETPEPAPATSVVAATMTSVDAEKSSAGSADVPKTPAQETPAAEADDIEAPQRFSWRLDADLRFHSISPETVAAPTDASFDEALQRFDLDPQGALAAAVAGRRPFSGVPAVWPLGSRGRRLAVTLAAFPTLRDGDFQGYAGFGLIVEELAAARPAAGAATPGAPEPDASTTPVTDEAATATEIVEAAAGDHPVAAESKAPAAPEGDVAPTIETSEEAVTVHDDAVATSPEPANIPTEGSAAEAEEAVADDVAAGDHVTAETAEREDFPAREDTASDDQAPGEMIETAASPAAARTEEPATTEHRSDEPADQAADAAPVDAEPARGPAAEARPVLTVHTNPPNVVALRTSIGQDLKRPQLSPGERNAFREIARALGARTEDEAPAAEPAAARTPEPLPPPAEQAPQAGPVPTEPAAVEEASEPPVEAAPPIAPATDAVSQADPAGGEVSSGRFVDSGTPFGPLPSAFGADTVPAPDASAISADLACLLDRVPTGLVVHRGNAILFANRTLLDWVGFADAAALERAGGISRLFAGGPDEATGAAVALTTEDGSAVPVEVNLSRVAWAGDSAFLFSLRRVEPATEVVGDHESSTLSELRGRLDEVEQILDTATDGIVIVTADGAIESMNRSAEALFGYESAEVKGRSITALFAPESHRSALDYCDGLLSNGVASVLNDGRQIIGRVKQGGLIPLYMTMGRTGPASKPKLAAVFRDMTQWKKAEEDLIAAKRQAEQASSQKSDFLAKISHEIRTPLNAIIGFSEVMMEERFGPVGNERYRDYLKDIHASGGHVLSLINDLLDLSKIEAGKLELAFTSVDLNEMVQSTVATMQPQANRDRVIIRSSLQPRLPNVVADARSLRQIVLNLLSNSVKFTPAGGQIIVSTGLSDAGEAVLRVRDTGIGMTESELRAAMEPFRQVATSNPRAAKGTGLGLPLTKALVEANRASFGITSTPNQGTLVEVVFPPTRVLAE